MHDLELAIGFLSGLPPFNTLPNAELESLASRLSAAYYVEGKTIFSSQPPPGLAVIRKGAVRLIDEGHKFLDKRSEGELFGHRIIFHGKQKEYIAQAEEDCLVWHLAQAEFDEFFTRNQKFAEYFSSQLHSRVKTAVELPTPATHVRDVLKREPVTVPTDRSIQETARLMSEQGVSSVLVMHEGRLAGIVTDKDLRERVLAAGEDPAQPIERVMTANPGTVQVDSPVDAALLVMIRRNCRHLPILDGDQPVGLVTAGDLLRTQSEHPLRLVSDIYKRKDLEGLLKLSQRLPSLFARMVSLGRDVEHIGRMVTHITDAFTVRLIQLAQQALGPAPMRFSWVVFGSQAREEQTAKTDQDNGLIMEREPDPEEAEYFEKLADFVCDGLDRLGYVYCPGEVMALNARWRAPLQRWMRHFDGWIDEGDPKSVMFSSIFFDMRCVHGDDYLVNTLLDYAVSRARDNRIFLRFMATNILRHRPPIGFFRRFVQEDDGSHSEGLNLKHRGIVPITDLARIRALEGGITHANTFTRLDAAVAAGTMVESDASSLRDALVLINRIRLSYQAEQMASGESPGNFVPTEELSPLMRRNLKAAFMLVLDAQSALSVRYQVR
jgi:CBS domain-containing protein